MRSTVTLKRYGCGGIFRGEQKRWLEVYNHYLSNKTDLCTSSAGDLPADLELNYHHTAHVQDKKEKKSFMVSTHAHARTQMMVSIKQVSRQRDTTLTKKIGVGRRCCRRLLRALLAARAKRNDFGAN